MSIKYNDFALLTPYIGLLRLFFPTHEFCFPFRGWFVFRRMFFMSDGLCCSLPHTAFWRWRARETYQIAFGFGDWFYFHSPAVLLIMPFLSS